MTVWITNGKRMGFSWLIKVNDMRPSDVAVAHLNIRDMNGPGREHFSLTYEHEDRRGKASSCGILTAGRYRSSLTFPGDDAYKIINLAFDLHLCNAHTGEPIHALQNARYHAGLCGQEADHEALGRHLRISDMDAKMIVLEAGVILRHRGDDEATAYLVRRINDLRPTWEQKAEELRTAIAERGVVV